MSGRGDGAQSGLSRREALKVSGLALGGLTLGGTMLGGARKASAQSSADDPRRHFSYFDTLQTFDPFTPLDENEMRISFMGSANPLPRRAQKEMSIFVEVGWDARKGHALDQFVFDMGCGVNANYCAMNVGPARMDKIFLNHLHGDHMNDVLQTYCFGPSIDRKSPQFVFGPGPSRVRSPRPPRRLYDDGTNAFCRALREACRWHSESFSFQTTSYKSYVPPTRQSWGLPCDPIPVADDPIDDAYALIPIELDWTRYGRVPGDNVAYSNAATGARVTHYPVIHCRKGSVGYKLEWNGMSMTYSSDTKPEKHSVSQAINGGSGVDVYIHEMVPAAEIWAYKNMGLDAPPLPGDPNYRLYQVALQQSIDVQNSSHTPQGAFGYLLSQIEPHPRLAVATHFPVADDTTASALESIRNHCDWVVEGQNLIWSFDLMILRVFPDRIEQVKAGVNDFSFGARSRDLHLDTNVPKYHTPEGAGDAYAQLELATQILPVDPDTGQVNYRDDGY